MVEAIRIATRAVSWLVDVSTTFERHLSHVAGRKAQIRRSVRTFPPSFCHLGDMMQFVIKY